MRSILTATAIGLAFGIYFVLRYNGLWIDSDSTQFAIHIGDMLRMQSINPEGYRHGYAYPTWAVTLIQMSGIDLLPLLQRYTPLVGNLFMALFGFATFRSWLDSDRLGLAAAANLFLIPELVFTVSRGNHEKLTTSLTLLAALALLRTFSEINSDRRRWPVLVGWTAVFYLCAFTLVSLNVFFGSGFIVASTVALAFAWLFSRFSSRLGRRLHPLTSRLVLVVATSWTIVMLVMFYVYPYATANLDLLNTTLEKLSVLVVSLTPEVNPYTAISYAWASPEVYRLISSYRWGMFAISFVTWLVLLVALFRAPERPSLNRILMLAFYGAFGFQLAMAIPVDLVGLSAGSNLQVRLYTYFVLFASPLMVFGVAQALRVASRRIPAPLLTGGMTVVVIAFASISMLKATLDPVVSNRWFFYQVSELKALEFWDSTQEFDRLWVGPSPRVLYPYRALTGSDSISGNIISRDRFFDLGAQRHVLFSPVVYAEALASLSPIPELVLEDRVYDNGETQIFHRTPRTPYQQ